ncbi:MAG: class IV adenylate cyclase [Anaerolineales bacterium]|nr:class IV adenylate cyclase [Anaerolineales bacterium]
MQETEVKFHVRNLERIESRLLDLDAHLIQPRILETNIRFDLPDGGLRSEGRVLRLRQDTAARLTYKGASKNEQGVLSRREVEFVVEDFEKAKLFLEALGYRKLFHYEKYRTTYILESAGLPAVPQRQAAGSQICHIMLDELPYGNFVEIEGDSIEALRDIAQKLDLKWDAAIATSYHALFERLRAKHPQLDPAQISFAALNGMNVTAGELSVQAADG